ncbi:transposase [Brenneria populi subsp. brevivirga]|uniref:transposase n=1 Tax=Brenneria populi TaxID=1505588 RepID=UPI002E18A294|nr:transposase [Brenneria populi subsp. brevivirga]
MIKDWAFTVNIGFHYLPPYGPNLNAMVRLWKVMNEHARNNRDVDNSRDFRDAMFNFFTSTLPEVVDSPTSRIHDRFQMLKSAP